MPRWAGIIIVLGLVVFGIYSSTHMVAAGDTWVALACGRHFDQHGVDTIEPFSFNSHHAGPTEQDIEKWPAWAKTLAKSFSLKTVQKWHPTGWINQNWLTHLIFYKLVSISGSDSKYNYNMLVYWKFSLFILTAFVVYAVGRTIGVGPVLALVAACFSLVVGRSFFDIRPACWSNLLVPLFLLVLALAVYNNIRYIWLLIPLVVFWANVHGGYIYAFIMLAPFLALHLLAVLPRKWSFALGLIGLWWVLYLVSHQFLTSQYYQTIYPVAARADYQEPSLLASDFALALFVLTAFGIGLIFLPQQFKALFYIFFGISTLILFLVFYMRMQLIVPYDRLTDFYKEIIRYFIWSAHIKYWLVFFLGILFTCLLTWKKERLVILPPKMILRVAGAGAASFIAMILFNPFHLTNLTHTFEISVSKHAASWRQVNEWRPAFDWMDKTRTAENPVGNEEAFAVLCYIAAAAVIIWLIARLIVPLFAKKQTRPSRQSSVSKIPETWPPIDLSLWTLAAMTIYMAIQSRRFIAIAGPAATPFVALLIEQALRMFLLTFKKSENAGLFKFQKEGVVSAWAALAVALLIFTFIWGWKYKQIYLDPWPNDADRQSIFMRMTASNVKPFEVCDFINGNRIRGRMFNYWTEGGALAFGQNPDPETGKIPLQLFMDGRAQAAYNHDKYEYWQLIFSGGPQAAKDKFRNKSINYNEVGLWLREELKKNAVWVIVMPNNQGDSVFMRAITRTDNWKTVFLDTSQQLLVDTDTAEGEKLVQAVLEGTAFFPNQLSRHLSMAMLILSTQNIQYVPQLMNHAEKAFRLKHSASSFMVVRNATAWSPFREKGIQIMRDFISHILAERSTLKKQAGYVELLTVAKFTAEYLAENEPAKRKEYQQLRREFREEAEKINNEAVW